MFNSLVIPGEDPESRVSPIPVKAVKAASRIATEGRRGKPVIASHARCLEVLLSRFATRYP